MMVVSIITDVRIYKVGSSYYAGSAFYRILERYAKGFGRVVLITRIIKSKKIPKDYSAVDNYCSEFINTQSIAHTALSVSQDIKDKIRDCDLVVLRLPSLISMFLFKYVKNYNKKYLTEAMGCAWDAFWNHGLLGKIVAPYGFLKMRRIIRNADYAVYVTNSFLQKRYPCKNRCVGVSNVSITRVYKPKHYVVDSSRRLTFLTAAALDVRYKGQQYMIETLGQLRSYGFLCDYYLAGGGDKKFLESIARKSGVEASVHFLGVIPHDELLKRMRAMDFYVQPSLQEGLPRSVIEAMSCGLVCFGSNTAGIPELLNENQVFLRRNVNSMVKTICDTIKNANLDAISEQNTNEAKNYLSASIDKRRFAFYEMVVQELRGAKDE